MSKSNKKRAAINLSTYNCPDAVVFYTIMFNSAKKIFVLSYYSNPTRLITHSTRNLQPQKDVFYNYMTNLCFIDYDIFSCLLAFFVLFSLSFSIQSFKYSNFFSFFSSSCSLHELMYLLFPFLEYSRIESSTC